MYRKYSRSINTYYNKIKILFSNFNPIKIFFITAYKPFLELCENLEAVMKMEKIMNTKSKYWSKDNENIPNWFYKMLISMGISVCMGFLLILAGSL